MTAWSDEPRQPEMRSALQIGPLDAALDTVDEEVEVGVRLQQASDDEGGVGIDFGAGLDHGGNLQPDPVS